jgi:predicted aspartyl protease
MQPILAYTSVQILFLVSCFFSWEAAAQEAVKKCRYVRTAQLPITISNRQPLIEVSVNGVVAPFLIDTGAYKTHLSYDFSEKIGLKLAYLNRSSIGVGGISQTYTTRVDEFSVGSIAGKRMTILVDGTSDKLKKYAGLIGADFLFQSDLELSLSDNLVRFFQPVDCTNKFLGYWDGAITQVDIESRDVRDGRPTFNVLINGHKVRALLDTGATTTFIDQATAKRVGMVRLGNDEKNVGKAFGTGSRGMDTWLEKFDTLQIGDEVISDAAITVGDFWGNSLQDRESGDLVSALKEEAQLILGMDYLKEHRVLFAISQKKIYISYLGGALFVSVPK